MAVFSRAAGLLLSVALPAIGVQLSGVRKLVEADGAGVEPLFPTDPGCYVRTPFGCRNHPGYSVNNWKRDEAGERLGANESKARCEENRKSQVAHWCDSEGVEMMFIPPPDPGCYVKTPSGCPNHPGYSTAAWKREEYGEEHTGAKTDRAACERVRKAAVAHWCGVDDIQMWFVQSEEDEKKERELAEQLNATVSKQTSLIGGADEQPEQPQGIEAEPGCLARTPSGCPMMPDFASEEWKHDEFAEKYTIARTDKEACEVRRKQELNEQCGSQDVETKFVESRGPKYPGEPGCYYRTPTGCPSHPSFGSVEQYRHEEYGERAMGAKVDRATCEVNRRASVVRWCGAEDVEMLFVSGQEPGCYVRTPWGCPNHMGFGSTIWKHDSHGEKFSGANVDRTACETYRGDRIKKWCGTDEVEMLFVAGPSPPPPAAGALLARPAMPFARR